MQSDKWTVEGAVKAGFSVSILQRSASVTGEGCVGTLLKCAESSANQGWYRRFIALLPVLVYLQGQAFLFSAAAISNKKLQGGQNVEFKFG